MPAPDFDRLSSMLPYGPEPTPRRAELHRLATELRALIDLLVRTDASTDALARSADTLAAVVAALEEHGTRPGWTGFAETANAGDLVGGDEARLGFFDHSPLIGLGNAIAPPIRLEIVNGVVRGEATFGPAYEGPPGHVHGGIVAAAFDEVLGMTQSLSGKPGMTARFIRAEKTALRSPDRCGSVSTTLRPTSCWRLRPFRCHRLSRVLQVV